ncbi:hypothetical protein SAMN05216503_2689 [Polaribacter sp. KT25b]|uniref:hypothetical protein n=1 Tax=Polaribacter sp. KT25b TaxID=1855336 RepID=UPI00087A59B2|nr:hypothetical protein [Polaribacter sp. KT25b]SDS32270.1 hypothetical protein SAMN05216503_2689 [Polaribacter sp. KT25b]
MINTSHSDAQIYCVTNFEELLSTPFQGEINAMCWNRKLVGDFSEIVKKLTLNENIQIVHPKDLLELKLSEQGQLAREILLNDFNVLKAHGASPTINIIKNYESDDAFPFFPTDVYSFHVDRSPIATDTFLCTYFGASSDILPNSQGTQKILIPEIRSELKKLYGESDEEGFESFLSEFFFDLHYQPKPNTNPISLGNGHIWKLAIDHPESKVLPCLHRAPKENTGENRLLLIC